MTLSITEQEAMELADEVSPQTIDRLSFLTGKLTDMRGRRITLSLRGRRVVIEVDMEGNARVVADKVNGDRE